MAIDYSEIYYDTGIMVALNAKALLHQSEKLLTRKYFWGALYVMAAGVRQGR